jgi:monoamine oxidase
MRDVHKIDVASTGGFSRAWSAEARYGGSYAVYRPGQVTAFWEVLRRPCGRIRLCGEHVATWTGYLEGAVESGERVATEILAGG